MTAIFISYRRQDTKQIAGRIFEKLEDKLGSGSVFMDIDSIPFGVDFHRFLDEAVARAGIVLVLIGHGWAEAKDEAGRRRLDNLDDFVRIEVESALKRKIPMGAVLVDGAPMPRAEQLPESMRALLRFNAAPVDAGRDFHTHMDRLIDDLERHLNREAGPPSHGAGGGDPALKVRPRLR
jgi:TIR domain